jgi:hypothetical protein
VMASSISRLGRGYFPLDPGIFILLESTLNNRFIFCDDWPMFLMN